MTDKERISELESTLQKARAEAAAMREALDEVWESCEMGWITDGDPDSSYCECGECGAKQLNSKESVIHCEDCLQGKVHKALATDSNKAVQSDARADLSPCSTTSRSSGNSTPRRGGIGAMRGLRK